MLSPASGTFTVVDDESGKTLGTFVGRNPKLEVQVTRHLLLEVSR
jgi:hypothetical protein